jgi:hypothetical protein
MNVVATVLLKNYRYKELEDYFLFCCGTNVVATVMLKNYRYKELED